MNRENGAATGSFRKSMECGRRARVGSPRRSRHGRPASGTPPEVAGRRARRAPSLPPRRPRCRRRLKTSPDRARSSHSTGARSLRCRRPVSGNTVSGSPLGAGALRESSSRHLCVGKRNPRRRGWKARGWWGEDKTYGRRTSARRNSWGRRTYLAPGTGAPLVEVLLRTGHRSQRP
jgi:hypothetical protein